MVTKGPLDGIRVVEWAHYHMGPAAGLFLADMGADVIHVEPPPPGDLMRGFEEFWGYDFTLEGGRNSFTEDLNRNKRSISIDIRHEEGQDILRGLITQADIFITNMRQGVIDKFGMDFETLRLINDRLIYCMGSGYGAHGPMKDSRGNEMIGLARGGLMLGSTSHGGEPVYPSVGANDRLGGIGLTMGVLAALVARERDGIAQMVHSSLLGWSVNLQAVGAQLAANTGQDPRPPRRTEAGEPMYNYYRCRDGVWVALGMVIHREMFWPRLCEALDVPELADDPRFASASARAANASELIGRLDELFGQLDFADWSERADRYDLIAARVNSLPDLAQDEQVRMNGYLSSQTHPDLGEWLYAMTPLEFSETPVQFYRPAPQCGENTAEILEEWLGLGADKVRGLRDRTIVHGE